MDRAVDHGTRVTIELEARYTAAAAASTNTSSKRRSPIRTSRCTTSIPRGTSTTIRARPSGLPAEPKEIKPHPYGIELGMLVTMLKDDEAADPVAIPDRAAFRASAPAVARKICEAAKLSALGPAPQDRPARGRRAVSGDPADEDRTAGDRLHLADRRGVCCSKACTRWCRPNSTSPRRGRRAVYRGNPFLIEVGAGLRRQHRRRRALRSKRLAEMLAESDARTLRQFLIKHASPALVADAADRILAEAELGTARLAGKLKAKPRSPSCTRPCTASIWRKARR